MFSPYIVVYFFFTRASLFFLSFSCLRFNHFIFFIFLFRCLEWAENHWTVRNYIKTLFRYSTRKHWMDLVCSHAITHFEYQVLCGIPSHCSWNTHLTLHKETAHNSDTSMLDTQMLQHACTCYSLHVDSWQWSRMSICRFGFSFLEGGLYWCSCKHANWSFSVFFHLWNPCVIPTLSSLLSLSWTWTNDFFLITRGSFLIRCVFPTLAYPEGTDLLNSFFNGFLQDIWRIMLKYYH